MTAKTKETVHVWADGKQCLLLKGQMIHKGQEVDLGKLGKERAEKLIEVGSIKEELKSNIVAEKKVLESKSYEKKSNK